MGCICACNIHGSYRTVCITQVLQNKQQLCTVCWSTVKSDMAQNTPKNTQKSPLRKMIFRCVCKCENKSRWKYMLHICTAAPSTEYCVYGLNNDYVPCDRNVLTSRDFPGLCTIYIYLVVLGCCRKWMEAWIQSISWICVIKYVDLSGISFTKWY